MGFRRLGVGLVLFAGLGVATAVAEPRVEIDHRGVRVVGLPAADLEAVSRLELSREAWRQVLRVTAIADRVDDIDEAGSRSASDIPALLGAYDLALDAGAVRFRPRFAPAPGLVLDARFDGAAWDRVLVARGVTPGAPTPNSAARFVVPEPAERRRAQVLKVTPSGEVPANLLRLYVHFSEPMSARHVLDHVELFDPVGEKVEEAFVEVPGGLWDRERTRLTLFIHPGRVKRGVGPNQTLGPVLETGGRYLLRVAASARDATGRELGEPFDVSLLVGPPDRRSPDPVRWRFVAPETPGDPLTVELDEPADTALLGRLLEVDGVETRVSVDTDGRRVRMEASRPWEAGVYRLLVPVALEDPSGNRVDRLFEEGPADADGGAGPPVELEFTLSFGG